MRKNYEGLGQFLKKARVSRNLSQTKVAGKLGYKSAQFISNWERGVSTPPVKVLRVLADLYDLSESAVLEALMQDYRSRVLEQFRSGARKKVRLSN